MTTRLAASRQTCDVQHQQIAGWSARHEVDARWDPPVTLAVRLVSIVADTLQHAGQAAFIRGILERGAGG